MRCWSRGRSEWVAGRGVTDWSQLEGTHKDHWLQLLCELCTWGSYPQLWCHWEQCWVKPRAVKPPWQPEMSVKLGFEYILTEILPTQLSTAAIGKPVKSAIILAVQILVQSVFRFWSLRQVGTVLCEPWKSSTEQSRWLVYTVALWWVSVRELTDGVCGKCQYLPSVCNYCQTVVFTLVRRCKAVESRAGCACCLTCGSLWFGKDLKPDPAAGRQTSGRQPGFQVPLCWALGEPGLGMTMRLWRICTYRPVLHDLPAGCGRRPSFWFGLSLS